MTGLDLRAKDIIADALDLAPGERAAYLERACAGDTALRARVERLLAAAEVEDDFLAAPSGGPGGLDAAQAAMTEALSAEKPGARIGPYLLLELVGEGGFGSVFLAQQERPVQRRVALKVIKLGMDTRAVVARFEQERQALAVMDHPNIAKVLDAGVTAAGRPYFVMEYVRGLPITKYCDGRKLSVRDRIELFAQVCGAVQHAHGRGIIHRDLKPSNILVGETDGKPAVKVIDFGIAKAMDRRLTDSTIYTEQRALVGTPEYMSPEQAEGLLDLDTRTDIYSLGVVLYELLVGTPPFDGRELFVKPRAEMERILKEVEPARPSTRVTQEGTADSVAAQRSTGARELSTQLKGELDWIVMRALEKDRLRRYESAAALAADLSRFLRGEAVLAAPPSRLYLARKFVRKHRAPVIAAALVFAALTAGTIGTAMGMVRARDAEEVAATEANTAKQNAERALAAEVAASREAAAARRSAAAAQSVNDLMSSMVRRADRGREGGRADIAVREVMDVAARELLNDPTRHEAEVTAKLAATIGVTYQELSLFDKAEPMLRLAAETLKGLHGEESLPYAQALGNLGSVLRVIGKDEEATRLYTQAKSIAERAGEPGVLERAAILNNEATLLRAKGALDDAATVLAEAKMILQRAGKVQTDGYAFTLQNIAAIQFAKNDLDAAEKTFNECLEVRRTLKEVDPEQQIVVLRNLGTLHHMRGRSEQALNLLRQDVALSRKLYGESLRLTESLQTLAVVYTSREMLDDAIKLQREALEISEKLLPATSGELAAMQSSYGAVLMNAERWAEAEPALAKATASLVTTMGTGHHETVYAHYRYASVLERRGAIAEAESTLRRVIDADGETLREGARYEWMRHAVRSLFGSIRLAQGSPEEARALTPAAADELIRLSPKMGARTRIQVIGAGIDRCIKLYEALEAANPGAGNASLADQWREKRRQAIDAPAAPR
jgi:serine/threonine protein kinase